MNLPQELLAEKNYTGTRVIPINDWTVLKMKKELNELQKKANPTLKKMEELSKIMDPFYTQIRSHQAEVEKLKAEMAPTLELYNIELKKVELIDQKAQLIKNKMTPLINDLIKDKLGEFEKALQVKEKGDILQVEVQDEIEEKIKAIRASKKK